MLFTQYWVHRNLLILWFLYICLEKNRHIFTLLKRGVGFYVITGFQGKSSLYIYHCLRKHCYQVNFSFTNAIMTIYLLSTNNGCSGLSMINYTLKSRNDFIGMSFLMNVFWFSVRKVEYVSDHFFCDQEFDNLWKKMLRNNFWFIVK